MLTIFHAVGYNVKIIIGSSLSEFFLYLYISKGFGYVDISLLN